MRGGGKLTGPGKPPTGRQGERLVIFFGRSVTELIAWCALELTTEVELAEGCDVGAVLRHHNL